MTLEYTEHENLIGLPDPRFTLADARKFVSTIASEHVDGVYLDYMAGDGVYEVCLSAHLDPEFAKTECTALGIRLMTHGFKITLSGALPESARYGVRFYCPIIRADVAGGDLFRVEALDLRGDTIGTLNRLAFERKISDAIRDGWRIQATHYGESQVIDAPISQSVIVVLTCPSALE